MKDNINIYFIFDKVAGVRWNVFLNSSDEAAIRLIKNDIFKMIEDPKQSSVILTRLSDSELWKYVDSDGLDAKMVKIRDLKDLVPFDLDLSLKVKDEKN